MEPSVNVNQRSRSQIAEMIASRTADEIVDLIWFLENSRQSWKRLAYQLMDENDSVMQTAMNWDGEIAAWKRR
jgi:hypothetical protein